MEWTENLLELIRMTGDRAKIDEQANGTYIVYKYDKGQLVKEHANGTFELMDGEDQDKCLNQNRLSMFLQEIMESYSIGRYFEMSHNFYPKFACPW